MADNEINKVCVLIRRFIYEVDGILNDKDACQRWLVSFAKTLQFQDLCKEPNEYALFLLREAQSFNNAQKRKSQIKVIRKMLKEEGVTDPTKEQIESKWNEVYGDTEDGARESQRRAGADSVRGTPSHSAPARQRASFRNKEEFIQWAIDTGLDPVDAGNCWEATMERGGLTKDGKKVENLCAYAVKWCRTSKKNRETA